MVEATSAIENNPVANNMLAPNNIKEKKKKEKKGKKGKKEKKNKVVTFTEPPPPTLKECFASNSDCSSSSPLMKSIKLNYKTVLLQLLAIYFLKGENYSFLGSVLTVLLAMAFSHIIHFMSHVPAAYPFNITHVYHHNNSDWFAAFIQCVLEFVAVTSIIFFKDGLKFFLSIDLSFLNSWAILLYYLIYTTVHNINYSIFHVNNVHENHHRLINKNMGPDFCDLAFGTKHDPINSIENLDHYLPNIVGAFIIIYTLQKFVTGLDAGKQICLYKLGILLYVLAVSTIGITSGVLYYRDLEKQFLKEYRTL